MRPVRLSQILTRWALLECEEAMVVIELGQELKRMLVGELLESLRLKIKESMESAHAPPFIVVGTQ
jgi:hypothetical protein